MSSKSSFDSDRLRLTNKWKISQIIGVVMNYEEEMNWMDSTVEQKALDWLQEKNLSRPPNSPLPRAFDAASNTVRRMLISLS